MITPLGKSVGPLLVSALLTVTACGGGGGGSNLGGTAQTPNQPPVAPGADSVTVGVIDALGQPAAGARVTLDWNSYRFADDDGMVHYSSASAGPIHVYATDMNAPVTSTGSAVGTLELDGHLDLVVTTEPWSETKLVGIAGALATASGISDDGRSFEFVLKLKYPPDPNEGVSILQIKPCASDIDKDEPNVWLDCIDGGTNTDAQIEVANAGLPLDVVELPQMTPSTYSAAFVFDQGEAFVASDPEDARLYMLKSFLLHKLAQNRVLIAAFSSSDSASGQISLLPHVPVTFFPVEDQKYTSNGASLLPSIDSLAFSEGGTSPLLSSLSTIAEFIEAGAPSDGRRVMVVFADGKDTDCGTVSQCSTERQALIGQLHDSDIDLITVGVGNPWEFPNGRALSRLAAESGGIALWASHYYVLADIFNELPTLLDGSAQFRLARFRLESPIEDTFKSGQTVLGTLYVAQSYWGGSTFMEIPFEVQIP